VHLSPGEYILDKTLVWDARHSNSVWKRDDGGGGDDDDGRVRVRGGFRMDPSLFQPASRDNHDNIWVALIPNEVGDLGQVQGGGMGGCNNEKAEVFFNGQPLILARYPNILPDASSSEKVDNRLWQWETIQNVTSNSSFIFEGDRPIDKNYQDAPDLWLHGYFHYDWADFYLRVERVDAASQTYFLDNNMTQAFKSSYGLVAGARYYVVNLLQELDSPGEYFIDRARRLLYFYPPSAMNNETEIIVSTIAGLVTARDLVNVTVAGIDFSISRGSAAALTFANSSHIDVNGGSVTNVGGSHGISVQNSSDVRIIGVEIRQCACGGIQVSGGNRTTLNPSGISILRNTIHDYSHWKRTYMAAISFEGVGHLLSGNTIYNGPHTGIQGKGVNDCIISYNYIHDLCYETVDCGAFYVGRSYAERGNVVENNIFEHIRSLENATNGYPSVTAIYLDDQDSGWTVVDNTIINSDIGIQVGGGRDNMIIGNSFIDTDLPVFLDKRGLTWGASFCHAPGNAFEAELIRFNYTQPPWSVHYPELVSAFTDRPCTPVNNIIRDIKVCSTEDSASLWFHSPDSSIAEFLLWNNSFANIVEDSSICRKNMNIDAWREEF